jgi:aldehyde dehydrogenase (NAD+)
MIVDHALKDGTQLGPVVSETQLNENMAYVDLAKSEGGEILCGGERVTRETEGYYMTPALVANTSNDWRINREEMFAPIACVIKADSYEQALNLVNDTNFGLTSGIITKSLARATHFRRNARTGCVMINLATAGTDYHVPFGGRGDSSYGSREQGGYAEEFYTTVKTSYIASGTPE